MEPGAPEPTDASYNGSEHPRPPKESERALLHALEEARLEWPSVIAAKELCEVEPKERHKAGWRCLERASITRHLRGVARSLTPGIRNPHR